MRSTYCTCQCTLVFKCCFLTEHASVCAGGAAASEEGEYEEEAEDGDDDENEREVHCRRVPAIEVGHDLGVGMALISAALPCEGRRPAKGNVELAQ